MAAQARANAARPLLKVKIGGDGDIERIRAVVDAAPGSRIILDANEGWSDANIAANMAAAAELGVALIEQPLPAGRDAMLGSIAHPVPICADESVHTAGDLPALAGLYDAVNIKLDKAGGLTAASLLRDAARSAGFAIMVGCMVGTSLAMAPAVLLAAGRRLRRSRRTAAIGARPIAGADLSRLVRITPRAGALGLTRPRASPARHRSRQRPPSGRSPSTPRRS